MTRAHRNHADQRIPIPKQYVSTKPSDRNHACKKSSYFESPTLEASQQRGWNPNLKVKTQILQRPSVRVAVSLVHSITPNNPPLANKEVEHVCYISGNRTAGLSHSVTTHKEPAQDKVQCERKSLNVKGHSCLELGAQEPASRIKHCHRPNTRNNHAAVLRSDCRYCWVLL